MPTPASRELLKKLYAKLGSLRATAAESDPERAEVMRKEAAMVAAEIKKIKNM